METRTIPGFSRYLFREDGNVITLCGLAPRVLRGHKSTFGYMHMDLTRDDGTLRRGPRSSIICEAFHGPRPPGNVCRHLDGNPVNDVPSNLAWGTQSQNCMDKHAHGTAQIGERSGANTIPESVVRYMKAHPEESVCSIARRFNVGRRGLAHAKTGKTWGWLK
jgi:hypothetical protein